MKLNDILLITFLLVTLPAFCMDEEQEHGVQNFKKIKELFESKIKWTQAESISVTTATVPGIFCLTTVEVPISMQQEFNNFFETEECENLEELMEVAGAIKNKEYCKIKRKKYRNKWPKSIECVADQYVQESFDCICM